MISYIDGDFDGAFMAWEIAHGINKEYKPLAALFNRIKRCNNTAPEGWENAWDWDVRVEPPEMEYGDEVPYVEEND